MGLFDWLFKKNGDSTKATNPKPTDKGLDPIVTFTVRMEQVDPPPVAVETFTGEIAGVPVRAEVPIEAKAECERLLKKKSRSESENEFLYYN